MVGEVLGASTLEIVISLEDQLPTPWLVSFGTIVKIISATEFTGALLSLSKYENIEVPLIGKYLSAFSVIVLMVAPVLSLKTILVVLSKTWPIPPIGYAKRFRTSNEKDSALVPSAFIVYVLDCPKSLLLMYISPPSLAIILLRT